LLSLGRPTGFLWPQKSNFYMVVTYKKQRRLFEAESLPLKTGATSG
jgi:hypothetical protein